MADNTEIRQDIIIHNNKIKWVFTPEAGDALEGLPGMIFFSAGAGTNLKPGPTEVNFKGYGLFYVSKNRKTVKVDLIEKELK